MQVHVGTDEAGLGPTLGPLCWGSFAWQHDAASDMEALCRLAPFAGAPGSRAALEVGDSKEIHRGTQKLAKLERTVLTALAWQTKQLPRTTNELWKLVHCTQPDQCPWTNAAHPAWIRQQTRQVLPVANPRSNIEDLIAEFRRRASQANILPRGYQGRLITGPGFNAGMTNERRIGGTKNSFATRNALELGLSRANPEHSTTLVFDKAGGRGRYQSLIETVSPTSDVQIDIEERATSRYRWTRTASGSPTSIIQFSAKADRDFPSVAFAACLAKYLRELSMLAFNDYFCRKYPSLRPTAGYPQDAKRFLAELDALRKTPIRRTPNWIRRG